MRDFFSSTYLFFSFVGLDSFVVDRMWNGKVRTRNEKQKMEFFFRRRRKKIQFVPIVGYFSISNYIQLIVHFIIGISSIIHCFRHRRLEYQISIVCSVETPTNPILTHLRTYTHKRLESFCSVIAHVH